MGSAVTAACDCGVTASIFVGGGMQSFMTTCYFPALCRTCTKVVQVNILAEEVRCSNCDGTDVIAYDDPSLCQLPGERVVVEWRLQSRDSGYVRLTDGRYKCPGCGNMSLVFEHGGPLWD